MKALLIGGTGTISRSISELLIAKGWELYLLNRGNRELPEGAHSLVADIHDEAAVAAATGGLYFDVVADFIAYTTADVQRDMRLFGAYMGQYIFISSASAYQKPLARLPITESTPLYNPYWEYSRDKIACEEWLMELYRQSGQPVTIVRPSHTYDKTYVPVGIHGDGGAWQVLRRMQQGQPVLVHGDGTSLWTLTHARDFAKGFVGLMANPHAVGEAVQITSDEVLSWNGIYTAIAAALNVKPVLAHVSSDAIIKEGQNHGYDFGGNLLGDKAHSVLFDNTKLKRLVPGFTATTRFDEGVREAVVNMQNTPGLQTEDSAFDVFCDAVIKKYT